ncbi:hypothetical protein WG8_4785, partial [Paenibacillus sp. Aloe-11]
MTDKLNPIQDLHRAFAQKEKPERELDEQGIHELKQTLEASHTKWWDVRCLVPEADMTATAKRASAGMEEADTTVAVREIEEDISGEMGVGQARIAAE